MSLPARRRAAQRQATLTIGDVLAHLKPEFPDLTISKIRFLEGEGVVQPERSPSGYRKFSAADLSRLRYVLAQQKDHYLPLKVIKEQLEAIDRGLVPAGVSATAGSTPRVPQMSIASIEDNTLTADRPAKPAMRLSRDELLAAAGLRIDQLGELEQFGLITKKPGGYYDDDALAVGKIVADLARFGLEGRHLRAFRTAAEREVGLFSQVVGPMSRQRGTEAKVRAEETVRELAALSVRLHAALVQIGLREVLPQSGPDNLAAQRSDPLESMIVGRTRSAAAAAEATLEDLTGPFYDGHGVLVRLDISPSMLAERVATNTVFGLQTADAAWVYPAWQFTSGRETIPHLSEVLNALAVGTDERWTWALWLTAPNEDWHEKTAWQWLVEGRDPEPVLAEARADAARWAE